MLYRYVYVYIYRYIYRCVYMYIPIYMYMYTYKGVCHQLPALRHPQWQVYIMGYISIY